MTATMTAPSSAPVAHKVSVLEMLLQKQKEMEELKLTLIQQKQDERQMLLMEVEEIQGEIASKVEEFEEKVNKVREIEGELHSLNVTFEPANVATPTVTTSVPQTVTAPEKVVEAKKDVVPTGPVNNGRKKAWYTGTMRQGVEEIVKRHPKGVTWQQIADTMLSDEPDGLNYNFENPTNYKSNVYPTGILPLTKEKVIFPIGRGKDALFVHKDNMSQAFAS